MQGRQVLPTLDITKVNLLSNKADSYRLFNLLTSHISPDVKTNAFIADRVILSHGLKRVDPLWGTGFKASTYFEVGEDAGRLYLLALGICYYEPRKLSLLKSKKVTPESLHKKLDQLYAFESSFHDFKQDFTTPLRQDFNRLRQDILLLNPQRKHDYHIGIAALHRRIAFYNRALKSAKTWQAGLISSNEFHSSNPSLLLVDFMPSTLGVDYFPNHFTYPFQDYQIRFDKPLVKRKRPNKQDECLDILASRPMYGDSKAGIYKVVGMFAVNSQKRRPKHPRIYKLSSGLDLSFEYERTLRLAPYLSPRNYQPHLFSERYRGPDLMSFCSDVVRKLLLTKETVADYIAVMLRISAAAFKGLAEVMKNEVHGDIKSENLIVISPDDIKPIDFEKSGKFTALYASPERLRGLPLTPQSDVWSMMRALVNLWGDSHMIWTMNNPTTENQYKIASIILANDLDALLESIRYFLNFWATHGVITSGMKEKLYALFVKGHAYHPEDRLTAIAFSEAFKGLYEEFTLESENAVSLLDQDKSTKPIIMAGL